MKNQERAISFINTFDPPGLPLEKTVFPLLEKNKLKVISIVSKGVYRNSHSKSPNNSYRKYVWVPSSFRKRKKWCHIFYWLLAPFHLLSRPTNLNIFITQPPLFFVLGSAISRLIGVPYVIHIMDMYPDLLGRLGVFDQNGLVYHFLSKLAVNALKGSEKVIAIGRCMKQRLVNHGIDPDKIEVIPNWTPGDVNPVSQDENPFLQRYSLQDKFVVLYSGNMGIAHEFKTLLEAASRLKDKKDIIFLFIGNGAKRNEVERFIEEGRSNNLMLLDYQPLETLAFSLSAASVHFMSLREGFEGIMVPSKFYSALASGRPVIYEGKDSGEVAQEVKEVKCGAVIKPGDTDGLYEQILYYYMNKAAANRDGKRARKAHETRHLPSRCAEKFQQRLVNLFNIAMRHNK